jgi:hypothetical protein
MYPRSSSGKLTIVAGLFPEYPLMKDCVTVFGTLNR